MKFYEIKSEWCWGDGSEQKKAIQTEALAAVGVQEIDGRVIYTAEQAVGLVNLGYCGTHFNIKDHIKPIFEVPDQLDIKILTKPFYLRTLVPIIFKPTSLTAGEFRLSSHNPTNAALIMYWAETSRW